MEHVGLSIGQPIVKQVLLLEICQQMIQQIISKLFSF